MTTNNSANLVNSTSGTQIGAVNIRTLTAASSPSLLVTGLSSVYRDYKLILNNIVPTTQGDKLWVYFSADGGSTVYPDYAWNATVTSAQNVATPVIAVGAGSGLSTVELTSLGISTDALSGAPDLGLDGIIELIGAGSARPLRLFAELGYLPVSTYYHTLVSGSAMANNALVTNAIKFVMSTGTIKSGTITLTGIPT